jgi:F-type H+-transporting ATPase subunit delta
MIEAYANSLFELGKEENLLEVFYKHFLIIDKLYKEEQIKDFLEDKFVSNKEKDLIIEKYFDAFNQYFKNFLHLLIKDNQFDNLLQIKELFLNSYYIEKGILKGTVYGVNLASDDLALLEKTFSKKLNKNVSLTFIKDSSVIGGYRVEIGSRVYDTSYLHKLKLLQESLKKEA